VLLLLGVGVAATLGQVFVTLAFTTGQPDRVSVVGLMQIVFALGLDLLIHGPNLQPVALFGIGLVLAPTAWMMAGKAKEGHPSEPEPIQVRVASRLPSPHESHSALGGSNASIR
jgi:drug/metabolite transporter (DMT)-like permease